MGNDRHDQRRVVTPTNGKPPWRSSDTFLVLCAAFEVVMYVWRGPIVHLLFGAGLMATLFISRMAWRAGYWRGRCEEYERMMGAADLIGERIAEQVNKSIAEGFEVDIERFFPPKGSGN